MKKWKMKLQNQNQNQNHTLHVTSSSTFNYQLVSQQERLAFSRQSPEFLSSRSVLKLDSVCSSLMLGSNTVSSMDCVDLTPTVLSSPSCCCTYVLCLFSTHSFFHHAENNLIYKYQMNPTFLRVTKLLSSRLTDVRMHVGVIFIFYKSSFTSSLFNAPAVEGFPAVRMRDDILQRSGGRKEIKNKNGDERFLWDEVTSSAQTSLAWFHMRSADWTFWQPPLLRQRRNRFLRSVISDFRCGCGTMSSFPAQLLISYPEMSACRRWRMKTNHSPCKNWLNDRL